MRVIFTAIFVSLMIVLFFSGAWYTMIKDTEVVSESSLSKAEEVPKKDKVYQDGEMFTERDPDGKEVFRLQVKKLKQIPDKAELETLPENKKHVAFELFVENLNTHNVEFKGYYTTLTVGDKEIKPEDFVVAEEEGWNKFRLESGGYLKLVLIYPIDKSTNDMKLIVAPEFYYKEFTYRFETK